MISPEDLKKLYTRHGANWDEINIFGIRNVENPEADKFDDIIGVCWNGLIRTFIGTTDPGMYWTTHPMTAEGVTGAAHLCLGYHQYIWRVGIHSRSTSFAHEALVQTGNKVRIWRDVDGDSLKDDDDPIQSGYYGINLHRASASKVLDSVGMYSAGCQVVRDVNDFMILMEVVKNSDHFKRFDGDARFSYMLFDKSQI